MIVVVTAEAESDLEQIATYIARQSVEVALGFVQELREKCESFADAPLGAAPPTSGNPPPTVR